MRYRRRISAFHVLVAAMLAVGVGATTAIFSVVNGVLLRPLPFPDAGQLVLVGELSPQLPQLSQQFAFFDTPSAFLAWRRGASDFQGLAALQNTSFTLAGQGKPRVLTGAVVTPNFFDVLGATPELGRFFVQADAADSSRPMVITDALWRSAFGADPGVIGRVVGTPGHSARVIGVIPDRFRIGDRELGPMTAGAPTDLFIPFEIGQKTAGDVRSVWSNFNYTVIGRLKPGVTLDQARSQINTIQERLAADAPDKAPGVTLQGEVTPVLQYATDASRHQLWLLLGSVAAVLLIISVNLGGLWMSRVIAGGRDWAIRLAIGADAGRLVRQVLREGLTLGIVGGSLGIACAALALRGLVALAPKDIPRLAEVHVDWRVLALGLLLSVSAGLLTALIPALRVGRGDVREALSGGGRSGTVGAASVRSRQGLIGLQAALTTLLIAVASLLGFSLYQLMTKPVGFSSEQAIEARVVLNPYSRAQRDQILQQLPGALEAIPGVRAAGLTSHLPLQGETWVDGAGAPGVHYSTAEQPSVNVRFIGGDYFSTMRIPMIAGRDFLESDRPAGWPPATQADEEKMHETVIISAAAARRIWPGRDPRTLIGQTMAFNGATPTIVGVAADALDGTLTSAPPAVAYQPYWGWDPPAVSVVVRTSLPLTAMAAPIRAAIWKLAPNAPIPDIAPLQSLRDAATAPQRYQLTLLTAFAALALLLAAIGVYALVAHTVAQRQKELAIRLALGAPAGAIRRLIAGQALTPAGVGALVGLAAALAGGRLLQSLLYGVGASNPLMLAASGFVVLLAATLACVTPARRAVRTDPNAALRAD